MAIALASQFDCEYNLTGSKSLCLTVGDNVITNDVYDCLLKNRAFQKHLVGGYVVVTSYEVDEPKKMRKK